MDTAQPSPRPIAAAPRWIWLVIAAIVLTVAGIAGAAWRDTRADGMAQVPAPAPAANQLAAVDAPPALPAAKVKRAAPERPNAEAPVAPPVAAACRHCGVVESVQAVKVKGDANGVGAVAGGVLGGVVGNQFGKGNGRAAMTVLGAVGGGFAGHEVEKQVKAKTVYSVKLRMDDGSLRTVQQAQAPGVGERFRVDGANLHAI